MLLEMCVGQVCGFDLSSLDAYRWHPGTENVDIDRSADRRIDTCSAERRDASADTHVNTVDCR